MALTCSTSFTHEPYTLDLSTIWLPHEPDSTRLVHTCTTTDVINLSRTQKVIFDRAFWENGQDFGRDTTCPIIDSGMTKRHRKSLVASH